MSRPYRALIDRYRDGARRGQGMLEFALALPILLLLLLGLLEFGIAFDHHLTLQYATREGARTGAALANGGGQLGCATGPRLEIDEQIVAAVQRVLLATDSPIDRADVAQIRIYRATATGAETTGLVNVWTYAPGAGPTVDGRVLDFRNTSVGWQPCSRINEIVPDSLGVSLDYTYRLNTPLSAPLWRIGLGGFPMNDRTVMQLNPTDL